MEFYYIKKKNEVKGFAGKWVAPVIIVRLSLRYRM